MTSSDIAYRRLHNQHISRSPLDKPEEVVNWLVAVQAQDYPASLWGVGLRTSGSGNVTEADIEQTIAEKKIIRTWPMRGTLHFVAAEDVRWMLELLTPRVISLRAGRYRELELNDTISKKSGEILAGALEGGKQLTRSELYAILEEAGISSARQRGYHILTWLAQKGIICFGPRDGKQHTFTLLDEWVPGGKMLEHDEALAELARRYITSHGPATEYDFSAWSGLTVTGARTALNMINTDIERIEVEGQSFWFVEPKAPIHKEDSPPFLLPAFDELLCGYKDRSAILDSEYIKSTILRNGIFRPTIISGGAVTGTWKRTISKDRVTIETHPFTPMSNSLKEKIDTVAESYGKFLGLPVDIQ